MSFSEAVRTCIGKYALFAGRASCPEFWWFCLFVIVVSIVLSAIDAMLFGSDPVTGEPNGSLLSGIFQIAVFLPLLAAGWRRLQDSGRPGAYILLPMILSLGFSLAFLFGVFGFGLMEREGVDPEALTGGAVILGGAGLLVAVIVQIVVAILMLWWLTRPSDPGPNDYGPPPLK